MLGYRLLSIVGLEVLESAHSLGHVKSDTRSLPFHSLSLLLPMPMTIFIYIVVVELGKSEKPSSYDS